MQNNHLQAIALGCLITSLYTLRQIFPLYVCILFGAKLPDATVNNWLNKALVRMSVNKLDQSNRRHFVVVYRDYTTLSGKFVNTYYLC